MSLVLTMCANCRQTSLSYKSNKMATVSFRAHMMQTKLVELYFLQLNALPISNPNKIFLHLSFNLQNSSKAIHAFNELCLQFGQTCQEEMIHKQQAS